MEEPEKTTAVQAPAAVPLTASPRKDLRFTSRLSRLASDRPTEDVEKHEVH
jgi:hypothetical protein